jgi:hypothetical protein
VRCPYYLRDGTAVDAVTWAANFDVLDRKVATARVVEGARPAQSCVVSTIFVGLDMNWFDGPPLIFETMVFGPVRLDEECWRWDTEARALSGHEHVVAQVCSSMCTPLVLIGVEDPWRT